MNFECRECGAQIEGDFDEMDAPELCEECETNKYKENEAYDQAVEMYESLEKL